jgi:hypothetical protein
MVRTTRRTAKSPDERGAGTKSKVSTHADEFVETNQLKEMAVSQLAEKSLRGDTGSHPLLFGRLNEPPVEEPNAQHNTYSQAMAWEAEPEWQGESSEAAGETAAGSREPECCPEEC